MKKYIFYTTLIMIIIIIFVILTDTIDITDT